MRRIIGVAVAAVLTATASGQEFGSAQLAGGVAKTSGSQGWTFGTSCYAYDDSTSEDGLGLIVGGDMAWMQHFDPEAGCETITAIRTTVGSTIGANGVLVGEELDVFVWDDVNNDGDPTDVVLLGQGTTTLVSVDDDVFHVVALDTPVVVSSRFFIGANIVNPLGTFPAPMDTSQTSNGRAWVTGINEGPAGSFDPNDVNAGTGVNEMDAIGFPSVFLTRGDAEEGGCDQPCDMNCDGTVDASDIEFFIDILFAGATPCASCTGDTNGDGSIDAGDIEGFINCLFP